LALADQQTLSVKGFKFVGVRLMAPEPLQAAVAPFANRVLAQADLENIISAVVDTYRQAGGVVRVYVP
jgi:hemolysin activation/secretion protein